MEFKHNRQGPGRPQVLLLGNGLEYKSGQDSWDKMVSQLMVEDSISITNEQKSLIPFPLRYELLTTSFPAEKHLSIESINNSEKRLEVAMKKLVHQSNDFLIQLPTLDADHILTTNYSYCIEKAFWPKEDFLKSNIRTKHRFSLQKNRERDYRLHSGYLASSQSRRNTGIWHIHGECGNVRSIIIGHDRYGRLLTKVINTCKAQQYKTSQINTLNYSFKSWPELFLYGDIYILGFSFDLCEFDLWWLLRRKQREHYADGEVFFYERRPLPGYSDPRLLLLQAYGVNLTDVGCTVATDYDTFYNKALNDIKSKIITNRNNR